MSGLAIFTLYGMLGCKHCEEAEKFLKIRSLPYWTMFVNGDPIIEAGIKSVLGNKVTYPVLVARGLGKNGKTKIVTGFDKEVYGKLAEMLYSIAGASIPSTFGDQQQPVAQTSTISSQSPSAEPDIEIDDTITNPTTKSGKSSKGPRAVD